MPTGPGPARRDCEGEATDPSVVAELASGAFGVRRAGSGLVGLFLGDQAADPLGEQGTVERLLERVVEAQAVRLVTRLVAGERDQDGGEVILAATEVLGDLASFDAAHRKVDGRHRSPWIAEMDGTAAEAHDEDPPTSEHLAIDVDVPTLDT